MTPLIILSETIRYVCGKRYPFDVNNEGGKLIISKPEDDLDRTIEKILKVNPTFAEKLDKAGQAWDITFQIINLGEQAGLTQKQLAELVGTKQ